MGFCTSFAPGNEFAVPERCSKRRGFLGMSNQLRKCGIRLCLPTPMRWKEGNCHLLIQGVTVNAISPCTSRGRIARCDSGNITIDEQDGIYVFCRCVEAKTW